MGPYLEKRILGPEATRVRREFFPACVGILAAPSIKLSDSRVSPGRFLFHPASMGGPVSG